MIGLRVFLCSTALDLAEYRRVADDTLLRLQQQSVVMERFGALPGTPVAECERLAAASDLAICVVAHRYGFVPDPTGQSITQREVEAARRAGKPVYAWIIDEAYPWTEPKEQDRLTQPDVLGDPEKAVEVVRAVRGLQDFKAWLRREFITDTFTTPEDLGRRIATALAQAMSRIVVDTAQPSKPLRETRVVRLFLSSPGDVRDERDAADRAVHRFNQTWFEEHRIFVKLVRWESMAPQIGPGPQPVVNKQLSRRSIDLFVGIMWNRFGTATRTNGSGTEQEFQEALASWRSTGRPWISFYFCQRPSTLTLKEELAQRMQVLEFRDSVNSLGIFRDYMSVNDFEEMLLNDLVSTIEQPEFQSSSSDKNA
jgi:hypothetical protein